MALTLPVEFSLKQGAGSLKGELDKANKEAERAAADLAKQQAAQVKYLDGIRARYFAEEQRRRETEVREAARAAADIAKEQERSLREANAQQVRYFNEQSKRIEREVRESQAAARAKAAAVAGFETGLAEVRDALNGVSAEEARLNKLMAEAARLYDAGAISAEDYRAAVKDIGTHIEGVRSSTAAANGEAVKGFGEVADAAGLPIDNMRKLVEGYQGLTGNASAAVVAAGSLATGALAVAAGAAAATATVAAFAAGIVAITKASADALPDLAKLAKIARVELFTQREADRVREAAAALDVVEASARAAGVSFSAALAPYVTEASVQIVSLNLAIQDFVQANTDLIDSVIQVGTAIANAWLQPLASAAFMLSGFLSEIAALVAIADADLAAQLRGVGNELARWAAAGPVSGTIDALTTATAGYRAEAEALIKGQIKLNAEAASQEETAGERRERLYNEAMAQQEEFVAGVEEAITATGDLFDATTLQQAEANAAVDDTIAAIRAVGSEADRSASKLSKLWDSLASGAAATKATDLMSSISSPEAVLSTVAATGPWGAFIAGLIDFVKNIDESLVSFQSFHMDFMESIASLPQTLVDHLSETLVESSQAAIRAIPAFIQSLADNIEPLIMAVVEATPTIAVELVNALVRDMPRAGFALAKSLLDPRLWIDAGRALFEGLRVEIAAGWNNIMGKLGEAGDWVRDVWNVAAAAIGAWWNNFVTGEWIRGIAAGVRAWIAGVAAGIREWIAGIPDALAAWWQGMRDGIAAWVDALVAALKARLYDLVHREDERARNKEAASKVGGVLAEVSSFGLAETRYGDTPGLVRAPPGGLLAHFMGGDIIGAARTREGLQKQTGAAPPAPVTVNLADGHRAFDREMVRALAQPTVRAQFFGFTAARRLA